MKRAFAIDPRILPSVVGLMNCNFCLHYDGDGFCALPEDDKAITGYIAQADQVVCAKWQKKDEGE